MFQVFIVAAAIIIILLAVSTFQKKKKASKKASMRLSNLRREFNDVKQEKSNNNDNWINKRLEEKIDADDFKL